MARRRILKVTGIVALSVIALVVIGFAAFYLRLAFGPVPLNFLTESIQTRINQNLAGMTVRIEGALVERNPANGIPQLRLQGVVISDEAGKIKIEKLPAGVALDFKIWHETQDKSIEEISLGGKKETWKKGLVQLTLKEGVNDLGVLLIKPDRFKK